MCNCVNQDVLQKENIALRETPLEKKKGYKNSPIKQEHYQKLTVSAPSVASTLQTEAVPWESLLPPGCQFMLS